MPRTYSDLLNIDSMTKDKVAKYGASIMEILEDFWTQADTREHEAIKEEVEHFKNNSASRYSPAPSMSFNNPQPTYMPSYRSHVVVPPNRCKTYMELIIKDLFYCFSIQYSKKEN